MKILLLLLLLSFPAFGQVVADNFQFVGNSSTNLFYQKTCREASSVPAAYKVGFTSPEEAEKKGFKRADACSKPKASFELPINGRSTAAVNAPDVNAPKRLQNLAEIDENLSAHMNRLLTVTTTVNMGRFLGKYLDLLNALPDDEIHSFQIFDSSKSSSWGLFLYIRHGELADSLCRAINETAAEKVRATVTFRLTEEVFYKGTKKRHGLLGDLIDYQLIPVE